MPPTASRLLLALAVFASFSLRAQTVSAVRSSLKVRQTDAVAAASSIEIRAAGNEFEAFQVVVTAKSPLNAVTVTALALTLDNSTITIPSSGIRVYREQNVYFTSPSNPEGASGWWPDPLVPSREDGPAIFNSGGVWSEGVSSGETRNAFPASVSARKNLVAFVDVYVPKDQPAGRYTGAVRVQNGNKLLGTISVALYVRAFNLPATSSLPTTFGVSIDHVCLAHGDASGPWCASGNPDFHLWSRLYGRFLLDHRITMALTDVPGGTDLTTAANTYAADYGSLIDGTDSRQRLAGARMTTLVYPWFNGSDPGATATGKMSQWASFAKSRGWFARSFHYGHPDEPGASCSNWAAIVNQGTWAHSVDPAFRVMVTGNVADYNACNAGSAVNILNPTVDLVDVKPAGSPAGNHRIDYDAFLASNPVNAMWMYQACDSHDCGSTNNPYAVNWPNFMVDATAVQNRAEPWMHFIYDAPGMLYWDISDKLPTAWDNDGIYDFTGQGDGTLVYPGTPTTVVNGSSYAIGGSSHIPVASYRLKMIREGLEDYEYLTLCKAVDPARAMAIARGLFPMSGTGPNGQPTGSMYSANDYPTATAAAFAQNLDAARTQLAQCIAGAASP
jgi:glycosyl hydrolase family 123